MSSPSRIPSKSANYIPTSGRRPQRDPSCRSSSEGDEYDRLGRNVSAQERRQELEPWVLVDRGGLDDNMSSYGD